MLDATVTSKGQITIPIDIRAQMGIKAGDQIRFIPSENGEFTMRRKKKFTLDDLVGCLPKPKRALTIEEINQGIMDAVVERYERSLPKRRKQVKK